MASSSSFNSSPMRWKYDIFLSFRGEDTRRNFTDHLYFALDKKGLVTFRDDERLERGNEIASELLKSIEESRISIIVLSRNYANSTWCLDELAKIVECMEMKTQIVLPIFYHVDPSDIRKQKGSFKKAFDKHEKAFKKNKEKVLRWRVALTKVANLSGWHLLNEPEAKMIQIITDEISRRQYIALSTSIASDIVGIDSTLNKINKYLEMGVDDVRFFGIHGMGGIGKTTIARVLYEKYSYQYKGCKSFLANVREVFEKRGLAHLQEQLISEVLEEKNLNIWNDHNGKNLIAKRLRNKKVLLVLDDVDQCIQLEMLAGKLEWFGPGSRIIITTRDEHVLIRHGVCKRYKVAGLNDNDALQLLHSKAFKQKQPTAEHFELSNHVIEYAKGLPLALDILGSHLCDRGVKEWKSVLHRLKEVPNRNIFEKLRISYDGLELHDKEIFLDIACFFKGKDKSRVMYILESCGLSPSIGIEILAEKSLISVSQVDNKLQMHDLIQEMGWNIVRAQNPKQPGKWSRLWRNEDIYHVLLNNTGTEMVEGIILDTPNKTMLLNGKSFSNMINLRLLEVSNLQFSEELEYLSNGLRFLKWHGYPLKSLPLSFQAEKLIELKMCHSQLQYLWEGIKWFEELKIIKLCHSCNLIGTPDFTGIPNLESLNFDGCTKLLEVHKSVGILRKLIELNLRNCINLANLPSSVSGMKSLQTLDLYGCSKLDKLPQDLGEVECLEVLDISNTAIRQIPASIALLGKLNMLSLHGCGRQPPKTWSLFPWSFLLPKRNLESTCLSLPSFTGLHSLKELNIGNCNLEILPDSLGSLMSLRILDLSRNNFVSLPASISQLTGLCFIKLGECKRLKSLNNLPASALFGDFDAADCTSLETYYYPSKSFTCTLMSCTLFFINCFKLVENQCVTYSWIAMLLKFWIQNNPNCGFEVMIPGAEIPEWISIWKNDDSMIIDLPPNWLNNNFMGFLKCAILQPKIHDPTAELPDEDSDDYGDAYLNYERSYYLYFYSNLGWRWYYLGHKQHLISDHLLLIYDPFCSRTEDDKNQFCTETNAEFNFLSKGLVSVRKCGLHLLYKNEMEYLDGSKNLDGLSM